MSKPIWEPSSERIERANISRFMRASSGSRPATTTSAATRRSTISRYGIRIASGNWSGNSAAFVPSGTFHEVLVSATPLNEARWFLGIPPQLRLQEPAAFQR
ncbi:hypothetical protein PEC18_30210 [Paucibacter sp. O1-1]|nr:hypothetical protein [Paucibacter sp. O1-1]MDA3829993.1 hypothetical protein [Paucibacter sp. O1-1]